MRLLVSALLVAAASPNLSPTAAADTVSWCPAHALNAAHLPGQAVRIHRWLHTCRDGTIRNAKGRRVRLLSLELTWMGYGSVGTGRCDEPWRVPRSFAAFDIARWGFNSVELFFSWQNLEPAPPTVDPVTGELVHHYNPAYIAALDQAIRQFRDQGLAVVLVMMQARWSGAFQNITSEWGTASCGAGMPAWIYERDGQAAGGGLAMVRAEVRFFQNRTEVRSNDGSVAEPIQQSFIDAWQFVAARYRGDRFVVGALPMFEAYDILTRRYEGADRVTPRALSLARFFEGVGQAIHEANPHLIVFFTEQESRTTGNWSLLRRPTIPMGAMTTEFYENVWHPNGIERMGRHYLRARAWHYPFFIDEFDAFHKSSPVGEPLPQWSSSTSYMLDDCRRYQISWALHGYGVGSFMVSDATRRAKPDLLRIIRAGF